MKKIVFAIAVACAFWISAPVGASAQTMRMEKMDHPRIANAIREIESAIDYMEHAPSDFGGHKAAAIAASRAAVRELRAALEFRAMQDRR